MCGIVGFFSRNPDSSRICENIQDSISNLHHRGPDDTGLEIDEVCGGTLALAQTRLAIIDLSPAGHQPMVTSDGRYKIVFNGEIYNYRELRDILVGGGVTFSTGTDTEVLLKAWQHWGEKCLDKLRGMFAFVIVDFFEKRIHCARDQFGIKPFYFHSNSEVFMFASEPRALFSMIDSKRTINKRRMYEYLINGAYDHDEKTFYSDIYQLRPGQMLQVRLNEKIKLEPNYWSRLISSHRTEVSFDRAADKVRELFLDSMSLHLRSDVPLGAALSGGVDSSSVVCAIKHLNPNIKINTFSFIARGSSVDEERWVDLINNYAGAIPNKVFVQSKDFMEDFDDFILAQGEPMGGMSFYAEYRVYKLAKQVGIKVMLDGHGADEVFAGYAGYPIYRVSSLLDEAKYFEAMSFLKNWSKWPGRGGMAGARALMGSIYATMFNRDTRAAQRFFRERLFLQSKIFLSRGSVEHGMPTNRFKDYSGKRLSEELRRELCETSCPPQLRCADRSAMRNSIENRVPFLHKDLVEYSLKLPENYLVSDDGLTKAIFRHAMRDIVPPAILNRRDKIGYAVPAGQKSKVDSNFLLSIKKTCERFPSLNKKNVLALISAGDRNSIALDGLSWRLLNFLRWSEMFDVHESL
jgi:asparagine synthase (glutamine-hydrolysing)